MEFILKGHLITSKDKNHLGVIENGYLLCQNGTITQIFSELPSCYQHLPLTDCGDKLIIPGMTDLHIHAPQYAFRSLGMDLELLDWLNTYTFPEESRYTDLVYAKTAYNQFVHALKRSSTTRACIFATIHIPSTVYLMEQLEQTGLQTLVGKVNMNRNCPESLCETDSLAQTQQWLKQTQHLHSCRPILTPRFTPSCTDKLMQQLGDLQAQTGLPMQSHLDENPEEIEWVKQLCPWSKHYADTYDAAGLLQHNSILAHGVFCNSDEIQVLKQRGCYLAHCPQSNVNLASGIAPIRTYLAQGLNIGLGTDVAGGAHLSMFRALTDAIAVSKLYWRLVDKQATPLCFAEAFWLATVGGGSFFGKVGALAPGYALDALVLDDNTLPSAQEFSPLERLERIAYQLEDNAICAKYVQGMRIL